MPCLNSKLGVLAVSDRLPSGSERSRNRLRHQILFKSLPQNPVDTRAQSLRGYKTVRLVSRRNADVNRLGRERHSTGGEGGEDRSLQTVHPRNFIDTWFCSFKRFNTDCQRLFLPLECAFRKE